MHTPTSPSYSLPSCIRPARLAGVVAGDVARARSRSVSFAIIADGSFDPKRIAASTANLSSDVTIIGIVHIAARAPHRKIGTVRVVFVFHESGIGENIAAPATLEMRLQSIQQ